MWRICCKHSLGKQSIYQIPTSMIFVHCRQIFIRRDATLYNSHRLWKLEMLFTSLLSSSASVCRFALNSNEIKTKWRNLNGHRTVKIFEKCKKFVPIQSDWFDLICILFGLPFSPLSIGLPFSNVSSQKEELRNIFSFITTPIFYKFVYFCERSVWWVILINWMVFDRLNK